MATVYETTRGWGVDYRDVWDRRKRFHVGSKEAAQAMAEKIQEDVSAERKMLRRSTAAQEISVGNAFEIYQAHHPVSKVTKASEGAMMRNFLRSMQGIRIHEVTPALIEKFLEVRKAEVGPQTNHNQQRVLKRFFHFLHAHWYISKDPSNWIKPIQPKHETHTVLSYQEEFLLLEASSSRTELRMLLGLDAGMRNSECWNLTRNNISLDDALIHVWSPKVRRWRVLPLTRAL